MVATLLSCQLDIPVQYPLDHETTYFVLIYFEELTNVIRALFNPKSLAFQKILKLISFLVRMKYLNSFASCQEVKVMVIWGT